LSLSFALVRTCRGCKHEWCWVCDGKWADHGAGVQHLLPSAFVPPLITALLVWLSGNHTGGYYKCNKVC
jgi:hypothetical protein